MDATVEMRELLALYRTEYLEAPDACYTGGMHRALTLMLARLDARLTAVEAAQAEAAAQTRYQLTLKGYGATQPVEETEQC